MPEYAKGTQQAIAASKKEAELMKKPAPTVAKKPEPVATTKPVAPTVTKKPVVEPVPVKKPEVTAPPVKKQEPVFTTKPFVETKPTVTTPVQKPDVFQETKKAQQEQNNSQAAAILNSVVKQNTASTPPKQEPFVGGSLFNTPSQQNNNLFSSFVQAASPQPSGTTPPTALGTSSAPSITPAINNAPSAPPAIVNAPNNAPSSAPAIVPAQQSATGGLFPAFMSANTQTVAPKTPTPAPVSTPTVQATNAQVSAYTSPFAASAPATSAPAPVSAPMQEKPPVLPPFSSTMGVNQQPTSLLDVFKSVPFTPKVEQPTTPATSAPAQGGITLPVPGSGTPVQEGAAADFMKERSAVLPQTAVPEVKKSFAELSPEEKQKLFPLDKPIVGVDQLTQMVKPPAPPSPMSQANLDQIKQKQQAAPAPVPAPMSQENLKRLQQEEAAKKATAGKPPVAPPSPSVTTSPTAQPTTPEQEMDIADFAVSEAAKQVDANIEAQMNDLDNQLAVAQQSRDTGRQEQLQAYKRALQEQRNQNFQQLDQMRQQMAGRGLLSSGLMADAQIRLQMSGNQAIAGLADKQMTALQRLDNNFKEAFDKIASAKGKLEAGRGDEISKIANTIIKENNAVQADAQKMDIELRKLQIEENKTMLNTMKSTLDRLKSAQINTLPFEGFYLAGDTEGLARALAASDQPELSVLGQQTVARIEQTKSDILRNMSEKANTDMTVRKKLSDIDKQRSDTTGNVWMDGKMLKDSKGNPIRTLDAIYNDKKLSIQQKNAEANKVRAATAAAKASSKKPAEIKKMTPQQQQNFLDDAVDSLFTDQYEQKGTGFSATQVKTGVKKLEKDQQQAFIDIMSGLYARGDIDPTLVRNKFIQAGLDPSILTKASIIAAPNPDAK